MNKILKLAFLFLFISNSLFAQNIDSKDSTVTKDTYNPSWTLFQTKKFVCTFPEKKPTKVKLKGNRHYVTENKVNNKTVIYMITTKKVKWSKSITKEKAYEKAREKMKEMTEGSKIKEIEINGMSALEANGKLKGKTSRIVLIINKKMSLLCLITITGNKQAIESKFSDVFINSFKFK